MNIEDTLVKFNNIFFYNVYKYFVFNNKVYNIDKTMINNNDNNDDIEICKKYECYNSFLNDNQNFDIIIYKNIYNNLFKFNESQIINYYLFIGKKNNNIISYKELFDNINNKLIKNNISNNFLLYCNKKLFDKYKINFDNFNFLNYNLKKTSVIYRFNNNRGYGDFIRGLSTSFLISILTNKNLYIDTSSNFKKILSFPLLEINENNQKNIFNLDLLDYMDNNNDIRKYVNIIKNENLMDYFMNKNIIITSNTSILSILKNNNYYNINTLIQFMKDFYINFFKFFPLNIINNNSDNNNDSDDNSNNNSPFKEEYIGIHIRCGDKFLVNNLKNYKFQYDDRIKDFNEVEKQLIKLKYFYPNQKFFICSDNNNIYDIARRIFNENLYTISTNNVENIHSIFIDDSKFHLLEHMILEHYYLTKSKYIIATYSQFSMTASLIGNIPLFSIDDYVYKDYNRLLQLNL
jgi:hypothetical protein